MSRYESVRGACDAVARPMSGSGHLMTRQCRTCKLLKASGKDVQGRSWSFDGLFWDCPACTAAKAPAAAPATNLKPVAQAVAQAQPAQQLAERPRHIHTPDDLKAWCNVDAQSGCWHWTGCFRSDDGVPLVSYIAGDGRHRRERGRRAALNIARKQRVPDGHLAWAKVRCPSEDCVNPAHAMSGSRTQKMNFMRGHGMLDEQAKRLRGFNSQRQRISAEQAVELRRVIEAGHATADELAAKLNVSPTTVGAAKRGERKCDVSATVDAQRLANVASIFRLGKVIGGAA
jgi:DNA-binding CsgD family transcriptional regulator